MFIKESINVVEMSKNEYDLAMTPGTKEYYTLREIRNDYEDIKTRIVSDKKAVKSKDKLTLKMVKTYVKKNGTDEQKAEFEKIAFAHFTDDGEYIEAQPFFAIKKWFYAEFPQYNEARDQHLADVEAIFKAVDEKIDAAKEKAAKAKREKLETDAAEFRKAS